MTAPQQRPAGPWLKAVPKLPWSASGRWRVRPVTFVVLVTGLWLFGTGEALLVASHLGNTPWTVLAQGVSKHSALSIGAATFAISLVVLVAWIPLRERPGFGTLANAVVIAVAIDVMLSVLPHPSAAIGRTTGGEAYEDMHWMCRIGLRPCNACRCRQSDGGGSTATSSPNGGFWHGTRVSRSQNRA